MHHLDLFFLSRTPNMYWSFSFPFWVRGHTKFERSNEGTYRSQPLVSRFCTYLVRLKCYTLIISNFSSKRCGLMEIKWIFKRDWSVECPNMRLEDHKKSKCLKWLTGNIYSVMFSNEIKTNTQRESMWHQEIGIKVFT